MLDKFTHQSGEEPNLKVKIQSYQQFKKNQIKLVKAELEVLELKTKQEIKLKQIEVESLQLELMMIKTTEKIIDTQRGKTPVASGKKKYLMMSLILGLFFGLIGVFVAEFVQKLKEEKEEDTVKK